MKIKTWVAIALVMSFVLAAGIIVDGLLFTPQVVDSLINDQNQTLARKEDVYIPSDALAKLLYDARNNITYNDTTITTGTTPTQVVEPATPTPVVTKVEPNVSGTPQNPIVISTTPKTTTSTSSGSTKKKRVTRAS